MKDIPARRMASVIEFALTVAIGFGFLARRYGAWVGGGRGGLAAADAPGLRRRPHRRDRHARPAALGGDGRGLLEGAARAGRPALAGRWSASCSAWRSSRRWGRSSSSLPARSSGWSSARLPRTVSARRPGRLGRRPAHHGGDARPAGAGLRRDPPPDRTSRLPAGPNRTNLFVDRPRSRPARARSWLLPLVVWLVRRLLGRVFRAAARSGGPSGPRWRPGRRSWRSPRSSAGWATPPGGARPCPGWPTTTCSTPTAAASLPDIQIFYLGQTYEYSLPWHNAWVLIADHGPGGDPGRRRARAGLRPRRRRGATGSRSTSCSTWRRCPSSGCSRPRRTTASACSCRRSSSSPRSPAGGRSGWPTAWREPARARRRLAAMRWRAAWCSGPAAWQLVEVHPFELSYYNELIGGPAGPGGRVRAVVLVRRLQRPDARRAERQAARRGVGRLPERADAAADVPGAPGPGRTCGRPRPRRRRPRRRSRTSGC